MKILSINSSPAFGKTPVMECCIKDTITKKTNNATLYKLNPDSINDVYDVRQSKNTVSIKSDFIKSHLYGDRCNDYYILQNDKTQEVISCAQVSHRYRYDDAENIGLYTLATSLSENKKYINGLEPMLAYITKIAAERYDNGVYAAYSLSDTMQTSEFPSLKHIKVSDAGKDGILIPSKRFLSFLDIAEKRSQINYEV